MQAQSTPEERAARVKVYLSVRVGKAGIPMWDATWRDSTRTPKMKRVGPAWIKPRPKLANPFIDNSPGRTTEHEPASQETWRESWEPKGTTGKGSEAMRAAGAFDVATARRRAEELVLAREHQIEEARKEEAAKAYMATPEFRAHMATADRRLRTTFAMVAHGWFREAAVSSAWKPTVARDYAGMLSSPYDVRRARARPPKARLMGPLGTDLIFSIETSRIRNLLIAIAGQESQRTANKYRTLLMMIFDYAVREGFCDTNPVAPIKPFKIAKQKNLVVLSLEQVEAVARAATGQMRDLIRVAANTGLRQGEIVMLTWGDITWSPGSILVERSLSGGLDEVAPKSNEPRRVPMSHYMAEILERISKDRGSPGKRELVFPSPQNRPLDASTIRRAYIKARESVRAADPDVPPAKWHELRHTFGTRCAAGNVPLHDLQRWMGHADIETTMRYIHYVPRHDDADRVSEALKFDSEAVAATISFNESTHV